MIFDKQLFCFFGAPPTNKTKKNAKRPQFNAGRFIRVATPAVPFSLPTYNREALCPFRLALLRCSCRVLSSI
jgi:hypothetical protein